MKSTSKNGRQHNALKHGAFTDELILFGESQKDFDELHNGCVKEFGPCGRMEEEPVLDIAKLRWRKRRSDQFFVKEAAWLRQHPDNEELRFVADINVKIRRESPCDLVMRFIQALPDDYRAKILQEHPRPMAEFDAEWVDQVKGLLYKLLYWSSEGLRGQCREPRFLAETANKLQELTDKQAEREERLDLMIDKALKRLAALKAFKDIMAIQEGGNRIPRRAA
jgi:hypothetical protein